jgi:hypothetical protein
MALLLHTPSRSVPRGMPWHSDVRKSAADTCVRTSARVHHNKDSYEQRHSTYRLHWWRLSKKPKRIAQPSCWHTKVSAAATGRFVSEEDVVTPPMVTRDDGPAAADALLLPPNKARRELCRANVADSFRNVPGDRGGLSPLWLPPAEASGGTMRSMLVDRNMGAP